MLSQVRRAITGLFVCAASILTAAPAPAADPSYDLLIKGGRVIDPASGRDGVFDVAVTGGRIAKIAPAIAPDRARAVIDAAGLTVTPGLVDIHTHVFSGTETNRYLSRTSLAASADDNAPRSCTTTVVDAGSAGHRTFATFQQQIIARSTTRVLAFLNIVGHGMKGGRFEQDLGDMDAQATAETIKKHRADIVGVKVAHWAGPGWEPIERATLAAARSGTRVMVDFGGHTPELSLEELLLRRMRPGDIFTHVYANVRGRTAIVDGRGALRPYVQKAHERGIYFDLGHGGASFVFTQAIPAIKQGLLPDSVSTDMHRSSLHGSMHDLVDVLSKLSSLGIGTTDLIRRSTSVPADIVGRPDLGRLVEGGEADIAVLGLESGRFGFTDVGGARIEGQRRFTCELTVRAGKVVWDRKKRAARDDPREASIRRDRDGGRTDAGFGARAAERRYIAHHADARAYLVSSPPHRGRARGRVLAARRTASRRRRRRAAAGAEGQRSARPRRGVVVEHGPFTDRGGLVSRGARLERGGLRARAGQRPPEQRSQRPPDHRRQPARGHAVGGLRAAHRAGDHGLCADSGRL